MDEAKGARYTKEHKILLDQRDQISKKLTEIENSYNQTKAETDRRKQNLDDLNRQKESNPVSVVSQKDSKPKGTKQEKQK